MEGTRGENNECKCEQKTKYQNYCNNTELLYTYYKENRKISTTNKVKRISFWAIVLHERHCFVIV